MEGMRRAGIFVLGMVVLVVFVGCAPAAATSVQGMESPAVQSMDVADGSASSSSSPALPLTSEVVRESSVLGGDFLDESASAVEAAVVSESLVSSPVTSLSSEVVGESSMLGADFLGESASVVEAEVVSESLGASTESVVSLSNLGPVRSSVSAASATVATHRAQVDFGTPVGDVYLRTLLDRYDAKMVVAYMTTSGFFGAHRAATSTAPELFIASARAETVAGFTNGSGGGMTTRARDFVGGHSAEDVTGDAEVRRRAESLLDLHRRLESARSNAVGGTALIHAVEVHGVESQLRLLGAESGVVGFEIAEMGSDVHWSRPPLVGGASGQSGSSSGAGGASGSSDDGQALYDRLSTLAEREIEGEE